MSEEPVFPIFAVMTPVETAIVEPVLFTLTLCAGAAGVPGPRRNVFAPAASGPTACAVHFAEPSGQVAVVHDCTGTSLPSSVVSANVWPLGWRPLGQGTPSVEPGAAPRPPDSSQVRVTASPVGSAPGAADAGVVPRDQLNCAAAPAAAAAFRSVLRGIRDMGVPLSVRIRNKWDVRESVSGRAGAPVPRWPQRRRPRRRGPPAAAPRSRTARRRPSRRPAAGSQAGSRTVSRPASARRVRQRAPGSQQEAARTTATRRPIMARMPTAPTNGPPGSPARTAARSSRRSPPAAHTAAPTSHPPRAAVPASWANSRRPPCSPSR